MHFTMLIQAFYPKSLAEAQKVYGNDEWWHPAAEAACQLNLVYDTAFGAIHALAPYDWMGDWEITREDMAQAVYNLLKATGHTATEAQMSVAQSKVKDNGSEGLSGGEAIARGYGSAGSIFKCRLFCRKEQLLQVIVAINFAQH